MNHLIRAPIAANTIVFTFPELNRTNGREILGVLRDLDQVFRFGTLWDFDFGLLPHAWNVRLPRFAHATNETVGAAQQQDMWPQGVATRKYAQILEHNRIEERCHQFIRRSADFLQAVDVRFGEHTALASDLVQLNAVISLLAEFLGGNFELGV